MAHSKPIRGGTTTLAESLELFRKKRVTNKRKIDHLSNEGWEPINPKDTKYHYDELDREEAFTTLSFSKKVSKQKIFCSMLTPDLITTIWQREQQHFTYPNKRSMKISLMKLYQYFAVYIRVQALQVSPKESDPQRDPQRAAFQEARLYFSDTFPDSPPPAINFIEKLKSHLHIGIDDEQTLSDNILEKIVLLGQWVAGDEKLFQFWGNSGWIRVVKSKPDHIGLWFYELVSKVSSTTTMLYC